MSDIEDPVGEQSFCSLVFPPAPDGEAHSLTQTVLGVPAGTGPNRPTSPGTSGREHQLHTPRLHLRARPSCTSAMFWQTTSLYVSYSH